MPPVLRVRRKELDLVRDAAERMTRRTNSRVEIDDERVEVADDEEEGARDEGIVSLT